MNHFAEAEREIGHDVRRCDHFEDRELGNRCQCVRPVWSGSDSRMTRRH
jgi:hypothetical protein